MAPNRKVTAKYILSGLIIPLLVIITLQTHAKGKHFYGFFKSLTEGADITKPKTEKDIANTNGLNNTTAARLQLLKMTPGGTESNFDTIPFTPKAKRGIMGNRTKRHGS